MVKTKQSALAQKASKGFTLIELLVVIAIIGLLAAVVLASLSGARNKGKDASAKESMASIRDQNEIYASSNNGLYNSPGAAGSGTVTSTGTVAGLVGACNDAQTLKLLKSAAANTGHTATCIIGLAGNSWVAYVTETSQTAPANFCVDSNGFSGELTSAPAHTTFASTDPPVSCQ